MSEQPLKHWISWRVGVTGKTKVAVCSCGGFKSRMVEIDTAPQDILDAALAHTEGGAS